MASEGRGEDAERPSEPHTAPVVNNSTLRWGDMLAAVKDHLPSMDSDSSASDCESDGELFIFQRKQPNLIPDLSDELLEFSLEDSDMQQTKEKKWNGDLKSLGCQEKPDGAQVTAKEYFQVFKDEASDLSSHTEEIPHQKGAVLEESLADSTDGLEEKESRRQQAREKGNSCLNISLLLGELCSKKERRKLIETKILTKVFLEPSPGHPELNNKPPSHGISRSLERSAEEETSAADCLQELTCLSLQNTESWDLHKTTVELKQQENAHNTPTGIAFFSTDYETFRSRSEKRLMEKLEELRDWQSRTSSLYCMWPSAKISIQGQENKKDVAFLSSSPSFLRMNVVRSQCLPEPLAVYIDLRDAELQKSVTLPDKKESADDSSTDEDETMTVMDQEERKMKNCLGKCLLLQQLHRACKEASELLHKASASAERLKGIKQDPESLEEMDAFKVSQNQNLKVREGTNEVISRKLVRLEPEERNTSLSSQRYNGADIETKNIMEAEKVQHSGNASESPLATEEFPRTEESNRELSQKEEQMKEKDMRRRFQEQLERSQPQQSVTGKQPMAEKTPVLFHMVSSSA